MRWMSALFLVLMVSCNPYDKADIVFFNGYKPKPPITVLTVGEDVDFWNNNKITTFTCIVRDKDGTFVSLKGNQWASLKVGDVIRE